VPPITGSAFCLDGCLESKSIRRVEIRIALHASRRVAASNKSERS
jgi:hypothetical protein